MALNTTNSTVFVSLWHEVANWWIANKCLMNSGWEEETALPVSSCKEWSRTHRNWMNKLSFKKIESGDTGLELLNLQDFISAKVQFSALKRTVSLFQQPRLQYDPDMRVVGTGEVSYIRVWSILYTLTRALIWDQRKSLISGSLISGLHCIWLFHGINILEAPKLVSFVISPHPFFFFFFFFFFSLRFK